MRGFTITLFVNDDLMASESVASILEVPAQFFETLSTWRDETSGVYDTRIDAQVSRNSDNYIIFNYGEYEDEEPDVLVNPHGDEGVALYILRELEQMA